MGTTKDLCISLLGGLNYEALEELRDTTQYFIDILEPAFDMSGQLTLMAIIEAIDEVQGSTEL